MKCFVLTLKLKRIVYTLVLGLFMIQHNLNQGFLPILSWIVKAMDKMTTITSGDDDDDMCKTMHDNE